MLARAAWVQPALELPVASPGALSRKEDHSQCNDPIRGQYWHRIWDNYADAEQLDLQGMGVAGVTVPPIAGLPC